MTTKTWIHPAIFEEAKERAFSRFNETRTAPSETIVRLCIELIDFGNLLLYTHTHVQHFIRWVLEREHYSDQAWEAHVIGGKLDCRGVSLRPEYYRCYWFGDSLTYCHYWCYFRRELSWWAYWWSGWPWGDPRHESEASAAFGTLNTNSTSKIVACAKSNWSKRQHDPLPLIFSCRFFCFLCFCVIVFRLSSLSLLFSIYHHPQNTHKHPSLPLPLSPSSTADILHA